MSAPLARTLAVHVENKPGALMRVSSLFARRGYNIESLAVGVTEHSDVSRITLRVECDEHSLEQIEKQLHNLVNVLRVSELEPGQAVEREMALIKVTAPPARRAELMALGEPFRARVVDLGPDALVFEMVGHPEEVDAFEELVRPHGVKEMVRTGRVGLGRASVKKRARARVPA
jgi:acetolactate synthase-1/3 small subunit